jgi:ribonuclease BN (tRNA processing enzyme)
MVTFTVLGSGSCVPSYRRSAAAYHVRWSDGSLLMDLGPGALRRATEAGIDWSSADAVLLTHFHMDHFADLLPYLFALKNTPGLGRSRELVLFGPVGVVDVMTGLAGLFGSWVRMPGIPLRIMEYGDGPVEIGRCRVEPMPVRHSRGALGFRLEVGRVAIAYSGDTGPCDELIHLCREADLAVLECAATEEVLANHLTPEEAGRIANEAGVRTLLLSHFYPSARPDDVLARCRKTYYGTILLAEDLQQIVLAEPPK